MYAHINLTALSVHIVKSVFIFDKVLYFYLLHDIYLANNLPPPPPANLPTSVYISMYAHILLFYCIHVNKVCLWTILIHSLPILKHKISVSPRFRTGSYNFPVDSEESIQSLMTAININNVRLLSQLL